MTQGPDLGSAVAGLVPLLLIAVVALGLRYALRRARPASLGTVRVVSRTGLTRGALMAIVEVDGRRLLVGVSEHGVNLLTDLGGAETDAPPAPPAAQDTQLLWPRTGLLDRLRTMTVRTPPERPFRVPVPPR